MARTIRAEYHVFDERDALVRAAAEHFVQGIQAAVTARGVARIAISGGNSPKPVFSLADPKAPYREAVPWDRLWVFWVDERCVPPDDPDSNFGAARELLLNRVPFPPERAIRMRASRAEAAANTYESAIRAHFRLEGAEVPTFDVVHLGMGPDGHTASLFPQTEALHEMGGIAVANEVPQQKQSQRVTLTWRVINARAMCSSSSMARTRPIVRRVLRGPYQPETLPSQLIQPRNGRLLFLLGGAAAAQLPAADEQGNGVLEIER